MLAILWRVVLRVHSIWKVWRIESGTNFP